MVSEMASQVYIIISYIFFSDGSSTHQCHNTLPHPLFTLSHVHCHNIAGPCRTSERIYLLNLPLQHNHAVRLYSTTSGRQTQAIHHPRPVINITWRQSQASSRFVDACVLNP